MSPAAFVWANLRRRPVHNLLSMTAVAMAFTLYGLALGEAEGFSRAAAARHVNIGSGFLLGAIALSAIGMALILFLTANAQAQSVRLRLGEFGLLKAIGFSHRLILALVIVEVATPCIAGAMIGLAAAKLLFALFAALVLPLAVFPPPLYTTSLLGVAALSALMIAGISGALPTMRVVKLDAMPGLTGGLNLAHPPRQDCSGERIDSALKPAMVPVGNGLPVPVAADRFLLRQIAVVTWIGLSSLRYRAKGALVIVVGVGTLAFALLTFLSMEEGIRSAVLDSGDPFRAIIRAANIRQALCLACSELPSGMAQIAAGAPGVARASDGQKLVDPETFHIIDLHGALGKVNLVGVGPHWRQMTPSFRLLSGRLPHPGTRELLAGVLARREFRELDGGTAEYEGRRWSVVGTFTAGDWWDGYLLGDYAVVKAATQSETDNVVRVRLLSPSAFAEFQHYIVAYLPANMMVERERDYYADFWRDVPETLIYISYILGALIATGAIAGTVQIMHGAVEARAPEIAVLRAIGFDGVGIAASAVIEAMLLATMGALGSALVWLWLDGFLFVGASGVFRDIVDLHLLLLGCGWGLTVALIGTVPLAVKMIRQSEIHTLQNL